MHCKHLQVYVVDAGKVKQLCYDPMTESTGLDITDISKACAKQRAGRAGRIRHGFAYRLYSIQEYESMPNYTVPDMLRVSLHDVCLKAKLLYSDKSIEQFLSEALQPPSQALVQNSIELLTKINALDTKENITHLGNHLAQMPIDCQLGKMVLYSILFRCIDPVITIVSALSVKNIYMLRGKNQKSAAKKIENIAFSDHQMLQKIYEEWQRAPDKKEFCASHLLSKRNMAKIERVRELLYRHLNMAMLFF